jgi:hypothetical protein
MTNGRTPTELAEQAERAADAEADAQAALDNDEEPTSTDYGLAFSPRQVAGGFAIIAALLVLIARRRRGGKKR